MKVLLAHNYYQSTAPSGENAVFEKETKLLRENVIDPILFERHNDDLLNLSIPQKARFAIGTIWSKKSYQELTRLIQKEKPDVAHFHNFFPQISPSAYYACKKNNIAVVQTLHNFRLFCANGLMYRNDEVCEKCLGPGGRIWSIIHRCYRHSALASSTISAMSEVHKHLHTFARQVDIFIVLTEFARSKFIEAGLPPEKIVIKPNFLDRTPELNFQRRKLLFVGRLSREKGVHVLLEAARKIPEITFDIAGSGPESESLKIMAEDYGMKNVNFLGRLTPEQVLDRMRHAIALVNPSTCYEGFPVTFVEAFAAGTPIIASNMGGMASIVEHEKNGLLFEPGNAEDLAQSCRKMAADDGAYQEMGSLARKTFEEFYTPETNFVQLMDIYRKAIAAKEH